ncbi:hypothetical protein P389DRAFT_148313, partial [Cystobasidium minutum MCA 4210]
KSCLRPRARVPTGSALSCPRVVPVSSLTVSQRPDEPCPMSQSFSRSYGSILPTSLIYIILWTRG